MTGITPRFPTGNASPDCMGRRLDWREKFTTSSLAPWVMGVQTPQNHAILFIPVHFHHGYCDYLAIASSFYQNVAMATATVRSMAAGVLNMPRASTFLKNNLYPQDTGFAFCFGFRQRDAVPAARRPKYGIWGSTGCLSHTGVEYYDPIPGKWACQLFGVMFYDSKAHPRSTTWLMPWNRVRRIPFPASS